MPNRDGGKSSDGARRSWLGLVELLNVLSRSGFPGFGCAAMRGDALRLKMISSCGLYTLSEMRGPTHDITRTWRFGVTASKGF
jgi:hypothetical protein